MPAPDPNSFATDEQLLLLYPVFADDEWTVTVTGSADGTYSVTVLGVGYDFVAVSNTIEEIRDGLVSSLSASGAFETTIEDDNRFLIVAEVSGTSLDVQVSPATLIATTQFPPSTRECFLTLSQCHFCVETWGCHLWRGHLAATAHMLKMWSESKDVASGTPTGMVTSMRQGPFSISWGQNTNGMDGSDSWWMGTPEGQQYIALRDSLGSVAFGIPMGGSCQPW